MCYSWSSSHLQYLRTSSLLCSLFVQTLLIRKHYLVVLLIGLVVLCVQTYLRSEYRNPCYVLFSVIVFFYAP